MSWYQVCKDRLTTSKHHEMEMYTKINSVLKSKGSTKPKTTQLIAKTIFGEPCLNTHAIKRGIENKDSALKAFYGNQILTALRQLVWRLLLR